MLLMFATGCDPSKPWRHPAGWEYKSEGYGNSVTYRFGDEAETMLVGSCMDVPLFILLGGDYERGTERFALTIDGRSRNVDAFQGHHGRSVIIEEPEIVRSIVEARSDIGFRAGTWNRQLSASPLLRRFYLECFARRKIDPGAVRWFNSESLVPRKSVYE